MTITITAKGCISFQFIDRCATYHLIDELSLIGGGGGGP